MRWCLARIIHESVSRDREDGLATGQPQGVESEAYLNSTSQVSSPEDAREDDHIIRARCAPLSPANGFPVSRSQQPIHELSGLIDTTLFEPLQQLLGSVHIIGSVNIDKGESLGIQLPNFF